MFPRQNPCLSSSGECGSYLGSLCRRTSRRRWSGGNSVLMPCRSPTSILVEFHQTNICPPRTGRGGTLLVICRNKSRWARAHFVVSRGATPDDRRPHERRQRRHSVE